MSISGTTHQEKLVLNAIVNVTLEIAEQVQHTDDWCFGYVLTVHSSQGLTIHMNFRHSGSKTTISSGRTLLT